MYTAAQQPGSLSQSALSYLQSLGKATKALRESEPAEKNRSSGAQHSLLESSRLSSERGSLSSMISQLRSRTRRESTIEESDGDGSSDSGKTPSIDTPSSAGERIVFDFPFDAGKSDSKEWEMPPKQLPGLKVGRKSIDDIRELRSSIDHSLIKPPRLEKQKKKSVSVSSYKEDSDSDRQINESENDPQGTKAKPNVVKAKSPFRPAVESGSDLESIEFEEASSPAKAVHFLDETKIAKSSTSSESSRSSFTRSSTSSQSTASACSSSRSSGKSKSSTESSTSHSADSHDVHSDLNSEGSSTARESPASVKQSRKSNKKKGSDSRRASLLEVKTEVEKYLDEDEFESSDSVESTKRTIESSARAPARQSSSGTSKSNSGFETIISPSSPVKTQLKKASGSRRKSREGRGNDSFMQQERVTEHRRYSGHKSSSVHFLAEDGTQTEDRNVSDGLPEFCSANLHHVTKDVLKTHLQLLKEFNRLEFSSLQEWNAILDDVRKKYEGPSTEKLEAVLEKRFGRMKTQSL